MNKVQKIMIFPKKNDTIESVARLYTLLLSECLGKGTRIVNTYTLAYEIFLWAIVCKNSDNSRVVFLMRAE